MNHLHFTFSKQGILEIVNYKDARKKKQSIMEGFMGVGQLDEDEHPRSRPFR